MVLAKPFERLKNLSLARFLVVKYEAFKNIGRSLFWEIPRLWFKRHTIRSVGPWKTSITEFFCENCQLFLAVSQSGKCSGQCFACIFLSSDFLFILQVEHRTWGALCGVGIWWFQWQTPSKKNDVDNGKEDFGIELLTKLNWPMLLRKKYYNL